MSGTKEIDGKLFAENVYSTRQLTPDLTRRTKECQDIGTLTQLKSELHQLIKAVPKDTTSFHARKYADLILAATRALDDTNNRINVNYFRFVGDPIPPASGPKRSVGTSVPAHSSSDYSIVGIHNESICLDERLTAGFAVLKDVADSTVFNEDVFPASLSIYEGRDALFLLKCKGPILVQGAQRSILVLKHQQLRLHDLEDCIVFVDGDSPTAVIENCHNVKFGIFDHHTGTIRAASESEVKVDDFLWPNKSTPSPHYSFVSAPFTEPITERHTLRARVGAATKSTPQNS